MLQTDQKKESTLMMEMQIQTKTYAAKRQRSDLKYHKVVPIRRSAKKQSTDVFSDRGQYERIQLAACFGHTKHGLSMPDQRPEAAESRREGKVEGNIMNMVAFKRANQELSDDRPVQHSQQAQQASAKSKARPL